MKIRRSESGRCWQWFYVVAIALFGCVPTAPPAPDVLCRIDSLEIKVGEFQSYIAQNSPEPDRALGSDVLSGLLDQYIDAELVRMYAQDEGWVGKQVGPRESLSLILEKLRTANLAEAEIEEYYRSHLSDFELPERIRLLHIMVEERSKIEEVQEALSQGQSFEEIAARFSQATIVSESALSGPLARSDLPPAFGELVFSLGAGEISEVIEAGYGYHVFQVVERLGASAVSFGDARDGIVAEMLRSRTDRALRELEDKARERYNVRLFERNLPFNYHGHYAQLPNTPNS